MLSKAHKIRTILRLFSSVAFFSVFSTTVFASGFQLFEQNAIVAGNYGASLAVDTHDASIGYFNSAGLTDIHNPQAVIGGDVIFSSLYFKGNTSVFGIPVASNAEAATRNVAPIPFLHLSMPLSDRIVVSLNAVVPFGLATDWQDISPVRYSATKTSIQSLNIGPSVGFKITDNLSVGAGFDTQYVKATLDSAVFTGVSDLISHNNADGWGYGWHIGGLYKITPKTQIGASFRSQVGQHLHGTSELRNPAGATLFANSNVKAALTLPSTTILSLLHNYNKKLSFSGTVAFTQWDSVQSLVIQNVQGIGTTSTVTIPQNYRNTWRASVGTNYQLNTQWLLRAGVGYDQTPTTENNRNMRLPDGDRIGLAIGAHYQATKSVGVDMGYTHLFMFDGLVHNVAAPQSAAVNGRTSNNADILGLQLVWDIA
ncbi:MAG: outer membrane protein transport protein [Proteobacteria bacterium]|nr:outer membrane protein transport protein [Pseudomonadota bacterium]